MKCHLPVLELKALMEAPLPLFLENARNWVPFINATTSLRVICSAVIALLFCPCERTLAYEGNKLIIKLKHNGYIGQEQKE